MVSAAYECLRMRYFSECLSHPTFSTVFDPTLLVRFCYGVLAQIRYTGKMFVVLSLWAELNKPILLTESFSLYVDKLRKERIEESNARATR